MTRATALAILLPCLSVLTACGSGDRPDFPPAYADRLQTAWDAAGRGENPTHACSIVVGFAVGRAATSPEARADAARAFEACYVDIAARYLDARLSGSAGDSACGGLLGYLSIARMSLGGFAGEVGLERAELDRQLSARVADRVRQTCPALADNMLGS